MKTEVRRQSDPQVCQHLWDAISTIRSHKQLPSFERIRRYMNRVHGLDSDTVGKQLESCVRDNLIAVTRKVGQKGSKVGIEQEGFRLPTPLEEPERHDWYCFECHTGGEVICCTKCYRVFHLSCTKGEQKYFDNDGFICKICRKRLNSKNQKNRIGREELNMLLCYAVEKFKERLPENLLERTATASSKNVPYISDRVGSQTSLRPEAINQTNCLNEPWRAQLLLHHPMDVVTMAHKAQDCRYKTPFDFEIDTLSVVHNVVIYHGVNSTTADLARLMLRDCQRDLVELEQCKDCFRNSHEKVDKHWFCMPCNPSHQLVYAKQKGYPYWPAKVMQVNEDDSYEVRFFGSQHLRATVEKCHVKPISVNIHSLQLKRTSALTKACEELRRYQMLLSGNSTFEDCLSVRSQYESEFRPNKQIDEDSTKDDNDGEMGDEEEEEEEDDDDIDDEADDDDDDEEDEAVEEDREEGSQEDQRSSITSSSNIIKKEPPVPEDIVSSSSQYLSRRSVQLQTSPKLLKRALQELEKGGRSKAAKDRERALRELSEKLKKEYEEKIERIKEDNRHKLLELEEKQKSQISETKRKQWCWTCEAEAIYHCCWNTAYCSVPCQQTHWQKEHKRLCRRKR